MEPILPNLLLLRHFRVERICVDMRWDASRMKRRIKVRDIDGLRQLVRSQLDQPQRSRVMPTEKGGLR